MPQDDARRHADRDIHSDARCVRVRLFSSSSLHLFYCSHSCLLVFFFFSSRRRHTRLQGDWSSDVCSSDLLPDSQATLRSERMASSFSCLSDLAPQGAWNCTSGSAHNQKTPPQAREF